ncbi:MAG TPA: multicopper oxidase domain-containing protein [Gaiellaceae bacterium]|nr:multicopper oxidase domain-containing protein [Gaiellaceae bacterium]
MTPASVRGSRALALAALAAAALAAPGPARAQVREYWIAAVPVVWHVVPNERDAVNGVRFDPGKTTFQTVVYRRFTPGFGRMIRNGADNQGIQGPLIQAEVGDTVLVHFQNLDTVFNRPHSMHFHGVRYRPGSDGAYLPGFSGPGANVKPGGEFTYRLVANPDSVGVWPYHDHSPSMDDSIAGGLYGALSIRPAGTPAPDHEFVVFLASQLGFMTIDGRAFVGNTPVFHARVGDLVQWDVLTLGDDFHTFHVHGHRWRQPDGTFEDTRTLGPAQSFEVRWREEDPGTWFYHCHVEAHMMNGMIGIYRVSR